MFKLLVLLAVLGVAYPREFMFLNRHNQTVWVGIQAYHGKDLPDGGGFVLGPGEQRSVHTSDDWAGRFWARTGCSDNGHCETGDCGNRLHCGGNGGFPPVTFAEITLKGWGGIDFYYVSLVDGYNLGVELQPLLHHGDGGSFSCKVAGCSNNLNPGCPNELRMTNGAGQIVGCKSSCTAYNTDQYCCRGSYRTPQTCNITDWKVNSASYFKSNCPNAYSYAYDEKKTYTCKSSAYLTTFY